MTDSPSMQELIVAPRSQPLRIDVFLSRHADMSRSKLQKYIKAGTILLNHKPVVPHTLVRTGDVITVGGVEAKLHEEEKVVDLKEPRILFEDENYLVVDKPSGLVVHGGPGIHEKTLSDWAIEHDPKIAEVGDQPDVRPGIVHRLDRDVSGVMVVAKTQDAFKDLKRQFQNHSIKKQYLALAYGRITDPTGRITFAIARSANRSGLMVARPKSQEGKEAETLFKVERMIKGMSLVRVETLTGRGHQIRVHFKAIGHPLVGDPLYKIRRLKVAKNSPPRLFLHATLLGFSDLRDEPRKYESPLPEDLARYVGKMS